MDGTDAAETMRARLQGDLRKAMKARAAQEVAVLRALIALIDNAGAVPLPEAAARQTEVERRRLTSAEVQALLVRERDVRQASAAEFDRLALASEAERARAEIAVIDRYAG